MSSLYDITKSLVENPRTPHFISDSELKKYMIITSKQIKLKSDVIFLDFEGNYCIVVYDTNQKIYRMKILPPSFRKVLDEYNRAKCICPLGTYCECNIAYDEVSWEEIKNCHDRGELQMCVFSKTITKNGYTFNSNGYTFTTINPYPW